MHIRSLILVCCCLLAGSLAARAQNPTLVMFGNDEELRRYDLAMGLNLGGGAVFEACPRLLDDTVPTASVTDLEVAGNQVFWCDSAADAVYRTHLNQKGVSGLATTTLVLSGGTVPNPRALAYRDGYLYVGTIDGEIVRAVAGRVNDFTVLATGYSGIVDMCIYNGRIHFATTSAVVNDRVLSMTVNGAGLQTHFDGEAGTIQGMDRDGQFLYLSTVPANAIYRLNPSGLSSLGAPVHTAPSVLTGSIAVYGDYLYYFVPATGGKVRRLNLVTLTAGDVFETPDIGYQIDAFGQGVHDDFSGDGDSDLAVYDRTAGNWYISDFGFFRFFPLGYTLANPVSGDYDGDGITDPAVYDTASSNWAILGSRVGFYLVTWGFPGVQPVPGDYDGDGIIDIAVYNPTDGTDNWYIRSSRTRALAGPTNFGWSGSEPVSGR